jgi:hypothetical protein
MANIICKEHVLTHYNVTDYLKLIFVLYMQAKIITTTTAAAAQQQ